LLLLCGLQWFFGLNQNTVFHAALTLSALCFILTGLIVYRAIREDETPDLAGGAIIGLFFLNYRLASIPLVASNGGRRIDGDGNGDVDISRSVILTTGQAVPIGSLLGLTYLARMDGLCLARSCSRGSDTSRSARGRARFWLCALAAAYRSPTSSHGFIFSWRAVHAWLPPSGESLLHGRPSPVEPTVDVGTMGTALTRRSSVQPEISLNLFGWWPFVNGAGIIRSRRSNCAGGSLMLFALLGWHQSTGPTGSFDFCGFQRMRSCIAIYYPAIQRGARAIPVSGRVVLLYFVVVVVGRRGRSRLRAPWIAIIHGVVAIMIGVSTIAGFHRLSPPRRTGYFHAYTALFMRNLGMAQSTHDAVPRLGINAGHLELFLRPNRRQSDGS